MINWLNANKEWFFRGLGALTIIGMVSAFWSLLKRLWNRRGNRVGSSPLARRRKRLVSQCLYRHAPSLTQTGLTAKTIIDDIQSGPHLQQPESEKHYRGLIVDWSGTQSRLKKSNEDEVELFMSVDAGLIFASVCFFR